MEHFQESMAAFVRLTEIKSKLLTKLHSKTKRGFAKKHILACILNDILNLCMCKSGSICLVDTLNQELIFEIVRGPKSRQLTGKRIPLSKGIIGWVATHGKPAHVATPSTDLRFDPTISTALQVPAHSILCSPILCNDTVVGAIEIIHSYKGKNFQQYQFDILQSLCHEAGIVIQRAKELEENKQAIQQLNSLIIISNALNSERKLPRLLTLIADSATKLMKSEAGSIVLKDEQSNELVFEATDKRHMKVLKMRLASGTGIIGKVINTGEKLIIEDFQKDDRSYTKVDKTTGFTTRSALCVPIKVGSTTIGALEVLNRIVAEPFSMADLKLFEALADLSAIAIQNAKLYENLSDKILSLEEKNQELSRTRAKLVESEKLAIIGEMAAGMSHEIRNLITPIKLIVDDLPSAETLNLQTVQAEYTIIKEQIERATEMTSGMLQFSRRSSTDQTECDINHIIKKCVDMLTYKYRNSAITVKTVLSKNLPHFSGVASQIEQVIINLIHNAENAIKEKGAITISTRSTNGMIGIFIRDTGCGIPKENLQKVFEPFFTTKDEKTGTGLGLTICAHIINVHNGTIQIFSTYKKGTTVQILLPVSDPAAPDEQPLYTHPQ